MADAVCESHEYSVHVYSRQYSACPLSNNSVYLVLKLCLNVVKNSADLN